MKIECDKCGAKYSIADEKVRGKTFKIRCKKCSNVIIVRDKAGGAASSASMSAEPEPAEPGWHLAINGETVGPLTEAEVRSRFDTGEIDKETAIWQEGFDDWIALSEVAAFSDLARRPPSRRGGDDPFASGSDDDYAAPSGPPAYPSASRSGARSSAGLGLGGLSAAASDSRSPRVSSLTAQRNENSVLFSLDSLQALAMGGGGGGAAASRSAAAMPSMGISSPSPRMTVNPGKPLATQAPASEGSGLIDIRSLGGMMGGGANRPATAPSLPVGPSSDETALPSFGGGGFGGLAAAPLIAQPPPTDGRRDNRSNPILYVMVALVIVLMGGMGAMMYFMVNREPSTTIVEKVVPGQVPSIKDAQAEDEDKDEKKAASDEEAEKGDADDKGADASESGDKKAAVSKRSTSSSSSKSSSSKSSSSKSTAAAKDDEDPLAGAMKNSGSSAASSKPAADSKPAGGGGDDMDVDCILDPSKCGTKKKSSSGSSAASSDPSLPEKLTPTDIKAGIASVKDDAKACGAKHGAAGAKVKVRLSISGDTGRVASATAQAPHGGTPLGNCVAAALKKAQFKKFKASSIGVVYPVSL